MKQIIYPPNEFKINEGNIEVFLGGTIEMGKSADWQKDFIDLFDNKEKITFLNPRRPDWDVSWKAVKENPDFYKQVMWELHGLKRANWVVMYLMPGTQSIISILETGLMANSAKLLLCCPDGFYRKGNIDIVCEFCNIQQFEDLKSIANFLKAKK